MSGEQDTSAAAAQKQPRRGAKWAFVALVLVLAAAAGGAWQLGFIGSGAAAGGVEQAPEPNYFTLEPELIVNFAGGGRARYLQLGIELMTYDADAVAALELHAPVLRNNLILLLSDKTYDELISREGKEQLAATALEEVRAVMTARYGSPAVETLYFTNFVMQ